MNNSDITIVIPCFNEEKRLNTAEFSAFARNNPQLSLLFVNDGSSDNTAGVLQNMCAASENMSVIHLEQNCGKAEAVRTGMLTALQHSAAGWIGFMDADLAVPMSEVANIFAHCEPCHRMLLGSRQIRLGAQIKRDFFRHFIGRSFATFASCYLRLKVYDTQCGAKFFRREEIPELFNRKFRTKWFMDVEILRRYLQKYGRRNAVKSICEAPLTQWFERPDSKISYSRCIKDLLILLFTREKSGGK